MQLETAGGFARENSEGSNLREGLSKRCDRLFERMKFKLRHSAKIASILISAWLAASLKRQANLKI